MADRFGSCTVFSTAIGVFTVASILCGISNTPFEFIAARALQGIGGSMMVPVGRLVVLTILKRKIWSGRSPISHGRLCWRP